ncbi:MAG: ribosome biogenesis GTPase YlqF [Bacilli bacterium]
MNINWYPGHMAKTKRLIGEQLKYIDIVYEIVDARIPYSSRMKDIDNVLKGKERLLIFTKIDLCDKKETKEWISYYEKKGYYVVTVDLLNNKGIEDILKVSKSILSNKRQNKIDKGLKVTKIKALILGIPNVGKSTLINRLVGKKATNVGNKPGITKSNQWIRINDEIELLDTPGLLWPKIESDEVALNLASMTAIKEEIVPSDDVAIYILKTLNKYYPNSLKERYDISDIDFSDIVSIYEKIGKKRGALIKSGEVDYDKVSSIIIKDLRDGYLGNVTFDRCS